MDPAKDLILIILKAQGKVWILVIEFGTIKVNKAKCMVNNNNKRVFQNQVKVKSMIRIIRNYNCNRT